MPLNQGGQLEPIGANSFQFLLIGANFGANPLKTSVHLSLDRLMVCCWRCLQGPITPL